MNLIKISKLKFTACIIASIACLSFCADNPPAKPYKVRDIAELNPEIMMDTIENGYAFRLKLDSNIMISKGCVSWLIEPISVFDEGKICCDESPWNCGSKYLTKLEEHKLSLEIYHDWSKVVTGLDVYSLFTRRDTLYPLIQIINLNDQEPMYFNPKIDTIHITVKVRFQPNCPYYEFDEDCTEKYLPIQFYGEVQKKVLISNKRRKNEISTIIK